MDCPDTLTTIQGSLSEMTVGQAKGAQSPLNHPWLDLKGWLKGGLSLMSPCLEVNSPMSLLMALWTLLRWPMGVRAGPGAVTLLTVLEAGTWWQMRKLVNEWPWAVFAISFLFKSLLISPLVHLKGQC